VTPAAHDAPRIGDIVHYVSYGTPGGKYKSECRAAIVTAAGRTSDALGVGADTDVSLAVLNPTGMFSNQGVSYHEGAETPGRDDCGMRDYHGDPHRYCSCGWMEAAYAGGTWHPVH
jgi:hypothetical protein